MREKGYFYGNYYIVYENINEGVTLKHNLYENARISQTFPFSWYNNDLKNKIFQPVSDTSRPTCGNKPIEQKRGIFIVITT